MTQSKQKILMCAPDYFGVDYVINPWMAGGLGKSNRALAQTQWDNLKQALATQAELVFIQPQKGLPDMVFTANAGMVLNNKVIVSRFHAKERRGEESHFHHWFIQNNFDVLSWPQDIAFEGAGDALLDRGQEYVWMAHGFRSDEAATALVEKIFGQRAIALQLVDPRFYHLDTCLCPLEGGYVMYFPAAFDRPSQQMIAATVPSEKRIVVSEEDGLAFACNAVDLNRYVFMNDASNSLQLQLRGVGFMPVITPLSEFMKSGGSAKCLTLKLVEP